MEIKSPAAFGMDMITGKLVAGLESLVLDYIASFPILIAVSIGVYALVGMLSKTLAKMGVIGVFCYGALIVMF